MISVFMKLSPPVWACGRPYQANTRAVPRAMCSCKTVSWHERCSCWAWRCDWLGLGETRAVRICRLNWRFSPVPLIKNRYGKGRVRVMRIHRDNGRQGGSQLNVKAMLEGDFARAYTDADNSTSAS